MGLEHFGEEVLDIFYEKLEISVFFKIIDFDVSLAQKDRINLKMKKLDYFYINLGVEKFIIFSEQIDLLSDIISHKV